MGNFCTVVPQITHAKLMKFSRDVMNSENHPNIE